MVTLNSPKLARQTHRQPPLGKSERDIRLAQAFKLGNRPGQACAIGQRPDRERGNRPAVQHDPVLDAVRGEKRPPALFAHYVSLKMLVDAHPETNVVFERLFDILLPFGLLVFVGRPGPRPG